MDALIDPALSRILPLIGIDRSAVNSVESGTAIVPDSAGSFRFAIRYRITESPREISFTVSDSDESASFGNQETVPDSAGWFVPVSRARVSDETARSVYPALRSQS